MMHNTLLLFTNLIILPFISCAIIFTISKTLFSNFNKQANDNFEKIMLFILILPTILAISFIFTPAKIQIPELQFGNSLKGVVDKLIVPIAHKTIENETAKPNSIGINGIANIIIYILISSYILIAFIKLAKFIYSKFKIWKIYKNANLSEKYGKDILVTQAQICAFISRKKIIISKQLIDQLSRQQIDLIISHERAHIIRNDAIYYDILAILTCLFWFNPFIQIQILKCHYAAEIACDDIALNAPNINKSDYADTIIKSLQIFQIDTPNSAPAVISNTNIRELKMRLSNIMQDKKPTKNLSNAIMLGLIVSTLPIGIAQFALAQSIPLKSADMSNLLPPTENAFALLDGKIISIEKNKFRSKISINNDEYKEVDSWAIYIDYGNKIIGEYNILKEPKEKVGDIVKKGNKLPYFRFSSLSIEPENCEKKKKCLLSGNNVRTMPSGEAVAWGNATFHKDGYDIHADIMFSNYKTNAPITAQDNVSIVENPNFKLPQGL